MTRRCVIEGCSSKSGSPQHRGVTFHSFPFESKTRDIWIVNCRIDPEKNITKRVLVCSRHFRRADFQPIKSNKYLLRSGAVPTIFPWGKIDSGDRQGHSQLASESDSSFTFSEMNKDEPMDTEDGVFPMDSTPTGTKRPSTDTNAQESRPNKLPKMTFDVKHLTQTPHLVAALKADNSPLMSSISLAGTSTARKVDQILAFVPGARIEAQDFDGVWHSARVIEVDHDEREVLIRFEKSPKNKGANTVEEWIPMNSSRLRQKVVVPNTKPVPSFAMGEKCMARWNGPKRFPATVNKVLGNDTYEVLFDDGYVKVVKASHMSKMKNSDKSESKSNKTKQGKKTWPLISISSLNLAELNLPEIPKDGEWCCHWVNDQPIGQEGFLTVGDHSKPTVIVEDWRLPPDWVKHMYQRSNVIGKWDVILVNPQGKRFRSKADLKQYLEELGQIYNPDVYDFSIHRRRAKDIGAYVFTKDYKPPKAQPPETQTTTSSTVTSTDSPQPEQISTPTLAPMEISTQIKPPEEDTGISETLEDGYVFIGSLKVQIIDNLFRCPMEGCNKNFRKENHLQIHMKHYHREVAAMLGACPNMQELACKQRTIGHPVEEPLPKNHLPNAQFFAKLHQQDLQAKTHRKSHSTTPTVSTPPPNAIGSPTNNLVTNIIETSIPTASLTTTESESIEASLLVETPDRDTPEKDMSLIPLTETVPTSVPSASPTEMPTLEEVKPLSSSHSKQKKTGESAKVGRKSSRQRLTKKYLSSSTPGVLEATFPVSGDLEETRHSFNATPEIKSLTKKSKSQPIAAVIAASDSNQDANSHTTGSFPENSQSPKYINENGEIIKIVRMRQEEIINCLCNFAEEDGLMIQCELCLCWQHGICNGIEKESQVPEKYICYICRNPQRGRSSLKYIHDQDWMYEGKLPVANFHSAPAGLEERSEILRKTHTLTGNLLEIKRFLHSLRVKINIAGNKDHPKMYLWAKKWETSPGKETKSELDERIKIEDDDKPDIKALNDMVNENSKNSEDGQKDLKDENNIDSISKEKFDPEPSIKTEINFNQPTIPQPEAAIDSIECQHRLLEHIQKQQQGVMDSLQAVESQITDIENLYNCGDADMSDTKARETIAMLIQDLGVMKRISQINSVSKTLY